MKNLCIRVLVVFASSSLVGSLALTWLEKPGASKFLGTALLFTVLMCVVSTDGRVRFSDMAKFLRAYKSDN